MFGRISVVIGIGLLVVLAAGCEDEYSRPAGGGTQGGPSGPVTGLLVVAQTADGKTVEIASERFVTWNVVDRSGTKIFGKDQISSQFLNSKGVKYDWVREKALAGSSMWLGKNYREIHVAEVKVSGEEKAQTATLIVDDATAAELRAIPNLNALVQQCRIVMLLGKIGA